jgi:hypothetical protein
MKLILVILVLAVSACSHLPKCGNPDGARIVMSGKENCVVRIRQVTVGSDLKIPKSLKDTGLSQFTLEWIEPGMIDGRIELGHFVLLSMSSRQESK